MDEQYTTSIKSIQNWYANIVYFFLGLSLVYALLYLASYSQVTFFLLIDRGMVEKTVSSFLLSPSWDIAIWGSAIIISFLYALFKLNTEPNAFSYKIAVDALMLSALGITLVFMLLSGSLISFILMSFFLLGICFVFSIVIFNISKSALFARLLIGITIFVLVIELAALVLFNMPLALNLNPQLWNVAVHWNNVELSLSRLAYPILPYAYFGIVLLGIIAYILLAGRFNWQAIRFNRIKNPISKISNVLGLPSDCEPRFLRSRLAIALMVIFSSLISCLFVVFTVLPWANPTGMLVSVDAPNYYQWISHMRSVNVDSALSFAFSNDRALFLVLAYALSFISSPAAVVQFIPAVLIVAFGVMVFLILRLVCNIRGVWVLGVLMVPFSFQALGLIYSGYFANMLALILVLAYVVLFFKILKDWSTLEFFGLLLLSIGVLASHPWTWFVFILSLLLFLFLEWRFSSKKNHSSKLGVKGLLVGLTLGVGLLLDLSRRLLGQSFSSASAIGTAQANLGLPNFSFLMSELSDAVKFVLGGVFSNVLLVVLSIIGFVVLLRLNSSISRLLVSWVFVGCLTILFAAQSFVFNRFLFLMPWLVFLGLGLFWLVCRCVEQISCRRFFWFSLVICVVFISLANFSLGYVFNINVW